MSTRSSAGCLGRWGWGACALLASASAVMTAVPARPADEALVTVAEPSPRLPPDRMQERLAVEIRDRIREIRLLQARIDDLAPRFERIRGELATIGGELPQLRRVEAEARYHFDVSVDLGEARLASQWQAEWNRRNDAVYQLLQRQANLRQQGEQIALDLGKAREALEVARVRQQTARDRLSLLAAPTRPSPP